MNNLPSTSMCFSDTLYWGPHTCSLLEPPTFVAKQKAFAKTSEKWIWKESTFLNFPLLALDKSKTNRKSISGRTCHSRSGPYPKPGLESWNGAERESVSRIQSRRPWGWFACQTTRKCTPTWKTSTSRRSLITGGQVWSLTWFSSSFLQSH